MIAGKRTRNPQTEPESSENTATLSLIGFLYRLLILWMVHGNIDSAAATIDMAFQPAFLIRAHEGLRRG
jgi:hypothetical protein